MLLGQYGSARSAILAPSPINYLAVHLKAGETWRYVPPTGHTAARIAVSSGHVSAPTDVVAGDMVILEESTEAIEFQAKAHSIFVLGSAAKHPHELVLGNYSMHNSDEALRIGEAGIRQKAGMLHDAGRL